MTHQRIRRSFNSIGEDFDDPGGQILMRWVLNNGKIDVKMWLLVEESIIWFLNNEFWCFEIREEKAYSSWYNRNMLGLLIVNICSRWHSVTRSIDAF